MTQAFARLLNSLQDESALFQDDKWGNQEGPIRSQRTACLYSLLYLKTDVLLLPMGYKGRYENAAIRYLEGFEDILEVIEQMLAIVISSCFSDWLNQNPIRVELLLQISRSLFK